MAIGITIHSYTMDVEVVHTQDCMTYPFCLVSWAGLFFSVRQMFRFSGSNVCFAVCIMVVEMSRLSLHC